MHRKEVIVAEMTIPLYPPGSSVSHEMLLMDIIKQVKKKLLFMFAEVSIEGVDYLITIDILLSFKHEQNNFTLEEAIYQLKKYPKSAYYSMGRVFVVQGVLTVKY